MLARREAPPETFDRRAMRAAALPHLARPCRQCLVGDPLQAIEYGKHAFDDMRIGVDHRVVELGAHLGSGQIAVAAHYPPQALMRSRLTCRGVRPMRTRDSA